MARKSGTNDESRERTRTALLQAGADLMLEDAQRNPFAALRLRRLCERAGLSTGAFYVHWPSLSDFQSELARQLTEEDETTFIDDLASMAEYAQPGPGDSPLDVILRVADADLRLLISNPMWDAMELVNITWGRTSFRENLALGYGLLDHKTGQIYGSLLSHLGREPRPPFDWDKIGTILQALVEGFGLRSKIDPAAADGPPELASGIYPVAVAAVLAALTRPIHDSIDAIDALSGVLERADIAGQPQHPFG